MDRDRSAVGLPVDGAVSGDKLVFGASRFQCSTINGQLPFDIKQIAEDQGISFIQIRVIADSPVFTAVFDRQTGTWRNFKKGT